jgi:5-(carboxyamino)imidazole ribonucleotide synthase
LAKNGFNVGNFCEIKSLNDIHDFADKHGFPVILKSRKGGYDGRGNYVINRKSSIFPAVDYLSDYGDISHLYCEEQIDFKMEISVLVAKCKSGSIVAYTVTETIQENGICVETITPARLDQYTMGRAYKTARDAIELFDGVGVFAVEMFVTQSGEIVINEISTRVHNSGHWTIEGADTSQFLQHIRLTVGCDIGDTGTKYNCVVMKNILGTGSENEEYDLTKMRKILSFQNSYLHLYGKREWRKNRKMGLS